MRVLVIGGGISDEREVSLRSASAVVAALRTKHEASLYDWDGDRQWLADNIQNFDVVFPALHGKGGEDGQIQKILEDLGAKYVGTTAAQSRITMDKAKTCAILANADIAVPRRETLDYEQYIRSDFYSTPHVIKPVSGGSSIDSHIIADVSQRDDTAVKASFDVHQKMLVEDYIQGPEITVPVMEGKELPVIEIIMPKGKLFDYENKYNGIASEVCPPENVPESLQEQAILLAKRCHELLRCRHLSRTDMIIHNDQLYVLEINTIPGFTDQSLFPKAAAVAGMTMAQLVDYLIQLATKE